ncbi:hypothetical protein MMC07_009022 [Pseudocyphellaria aurata]|nr:hypothetical protein [Pseudocyphellaria aurata]
MLGSRTGQWPALGLPVSTTVQPSNIAISRSQFSGGSRSKTEVRNTSNQAEVKPVVKPQAPRKVEKKAISKASSLKRERPHILESLSKPKRKPSNNDTGSSGGTSLAVASACSQESASALDDEPMNDASEDNQEEYFISESKAGAKPTKSKSEREEELRKMMEKEDEVMKDVIRESGLPSKGSQEFASVDCIETLSDSSPEGQAVFSGGRRRGRRKIMKKKTFKDNEGYLVTKEEPAWESFSEDEPVARKGRASASTVPTLGKGQKPTRKPGQGNITSFFGKK